jgi:hypothetical protein
MTNPLSILVTVNLFASTDIAANPARIKLWL